MFILHSDLNNFYASVEVLYNPSLRNKAVAVVGDSEKRHGIVLAKNNVAKAYGVKTGEAIWQAKLKCKEELICVSASMERYSAISKLVKEMYREYSDRVESFGIDEAWIDISHIAKNFTEAEKIANRIRQRVIDQFGLTVSIGVSYNKIFAKLGSDIKKPNATTVITEQNYKQVVWPLPVAELLYVGRKTEVKLKALGINTIGDLANTSKLVLKSKFGKVGEMLFEFANGLDKTSVKSLAELDPIKSIGNSTTCPRDLKTDAEVKAVIFILAESVAKRLRANNFYCQTINLWIKTNDLNSFNIAHTISEPTNIASVIGEEAFKLFNFDWSHTIRAVGVRATNLTGEPLQYNFFTSAQTNKKKEELEKTVDNLRQRFGYNIIKRGSVCVDESMQELNPEHITHKVFPKAYIKK